MKDLEKIKFNDLYGTTEFAEGVSILHAGFPIVRMLPDLLTSNRVTIFFKRSPKLDQVVQDFWNDSLRVSPRQWHSASRDLKARIRAEISMRGRE